MFYVRKVGVFFPAKRTENEAKICQQKYKLREPETSWHRNGNTSLMLLNDFLLDS